MLSNGIDERGENPNILLIAAEVISPDQHLAHGFERLRRRSQISELRDLCGFVDERCNFLRQFVRKAANERFAFVDPGFFTHTMLFGLAAIVAEGVRVDHEKDKPEES